MEHTELQQLSDVAQGRVGRALGDRRPLAAGELAVKSVEQPVEQFDLTLVQDSPAPVSLQIDDFTKKYVDPPWSVVPEFRGDIVRHRGRSLFR